MQFSKFFSSARLKKGLLLLPLLVALAFSYFRVFDQYELQTYDWRCQLRLPRPMSPDIVFIHIGEDTLQSLGQWPINRKYHAALIQALGQYGAKNVIFYILFT